jgi:hypothetical protein
VKKTFLLFIIFLFGGPGMMLALDSGTSGADILKVPIGVRPAALGGTYAAFGDDVYVMGFNPAGLARVSKYSLGLDHVEGFASVQVESLSVAVPTQNYGNFGGQIIFRHMPDIQNALATDPIVSANDIVFSVVNAQQFGKIAVGGAFKTIVSTLGDKQAFTQAIDLGIKLQFLETDLALVVQNIGPAVQFQPASQGRDPLPLTFRVALARPLIVSPASTLLASVEAFNVRDEGNQTSFGVEYWHRSVLALRLGYRFSDQGNLEGGFSAGAALRYNLGKLEYELGYAWRPSQVSSTFIANSHIFGLLLWY